MLRCWLVDSIASCPFLSSKRIKSDKLWWKQKEAKHVQTRYGVRCSHSNALKDSTACCFLCWPIALQCQVFWLPLLSIFWPLCLAVFMDQTVTCNWNDACHQGKAMLILFDHLFAFELYVFDRTCTGVLNGPHWPPTTSWHPKQSTASSKVKEQVYRGKVYSLQALKLVQHKFQK